MSWVAIGVGGATLIGGMLASDSAKDASEGQQAAAREANQLQLQMFNANNALAQPARDTGNAARDRLSQLLGLGVGTSARTGSNAPSTYEQMRAQLAPQFTTYRPGTAASSAPVTGPALGLQAAQQYATGGDAIAALGPAGAAQYFQQQALAAYGGTREEPFGAYNRARMTSPDDANNYSAQQNAGTQGTAGFNQVDEAALDAEIRRRMAEQEAQIAQRESALRSDPSFGSLSQGFQFNQYTPEQYAAAEKFSYTGDDLYRDPSYLFRLSQGQKALDRQGAAAGRFLSGGQLAAGSDYNQGAASQEFQNAYQRAAGTFNTNEANRFNAFQTNEGNRATAFGNNEANRYNAFQTNFSNTVNPLLALSGAGQLATTNLMNSNNQYANTYGNNLMQSANAAGAGQIAGANAINQGISGIANQYQTNQLMNRFGGSMNNNPSGISAANQASFDSLGNSNNWWGTS